MYYRLVVHRLYGGNKVEEPARYNLRHIFIILSELIQSKYAKVKGLTPSKSTFNA